MVESVTPVSLAYTVVGSLNELSVTGSEPLILLLAPLVTIRWPDEVSSGTDSRENTF